MFSDAPSITTVCSLYYGTISYMCLTVTGQSDNYYVNTKGRVPLIAETQFRRSTYDHLVY